MDGLVNCALKRYEYFKAVVISANCEESISCNCGIYKGDEKPE